MVIIRYETITRAGLVQKERTFRTEKEMARWIEKQEALAEEERGGFVSVLCYAFDEENHND